MSLKKRFGVLFVRTKATWHALSILNTPQQSWKAVYGCLSSADELFETSVSTDVCDSQSAWIDTEFSFHSPSRDWTHTTPSSVCGPSTRVPTPSVETFSRAPLRHIWSHFPQKQVSRLCFTEGKDIVLIASSCKAPSISHKLQEPNRGVAGSQFKHLEPM